LKRFSIESDGCPSKSADRSLGLGRLPVTVSTILLALSSAKGSTSEDDSFPLGD